MSLYVNCFGTGILPYPEMTKIIEKNFPLKPEEIIRDLDLLRPVYRNTACYGHFGREEEGFTWEKTDRADRLKSGI